MYKVWNKTSRAVWLHNKIPEIILLCEASTDSVFFFFLISEVLFKSILSLYFGVLMGFWLHYIGKCSKLFCPHSVIGLKWKCLWRKDKQREICRVYCAWLPRSVDVVFHQEQKQIFLKERGGRKKTSPDIRYYADSGWGEPEPSTLSWKNTSTLL